MRLTAFLVVLAAVAAVAADPRPVELCTTVAHTPLVVNHDDVCYRLSANVVHTGGLDEPAIIWRGARGELQFGGHVLQLTNSCSVGIVVDTGASLALYDVEIELTVEPTCSQMVAVVTQPNASLAVYGGNVRRAANGIITLGGGQSSLTVSDVDVHNVTMVGIGCSYTDECVLERVNVYISELFAYQQGIVLGGNMVRASQVHVANSLWYGVLINATGPAYLDDISVTAEFGLMIGVESAYSIEMRNVRTEGKNLEYPVHVGVTEASTMLIDGWVARDGDTGLIVMPESTQRGITVRNANLAGLYYGVYLDEDNWNLVVRDSTIATCCIGLFADVDAHNVIVTETMFENNFDSLDIQTSESVASGNLNTGDGYGFCYTPLRRRSNMPPPFAHDRVLPGEHEMWWALPHPYDGN